MDEWVDDDDGVASDRSNHHHHRNKLISYSQPLGRDGAVISSATTAAGGSSKRNALRKHSLDEDRIYSDSHNHFFLDGSGDGRALSYPHALPPQFPRHSGSSSSIGDSDGSLTLERVMSEYGGAPGSLPEFMGAGGGSGIFRVPIRAAMHPGRPPAVELRPHPLRETQVGAFLRSIAAAKGRIWAGTECGIRVWDLEEMFDCYPNGRAKRGDEESAPFRESDKTAPTLCLVVDVATGLVWTGHKDGKIRSWRMNAGHDGRGEEALFKEGLSWQAHRAPVLSMIMASYGDLWSSSEGGVIKVWPWESIEKALSVTAEKRHMATLSVERSFVDLRSQVTVNGVCPLPGADVKLLLSDNSRSKVWSASSLFFALWDSSKKELLKVFGIDGQVETRGVDVTSGQDPYIEDELKVKFVSTSKKEKSQGSMSFFQRSRNALMGAADAVRRVAVKGTFGDDNKRTEAMAISMDGTIWTGCTNGLLIHWDGNGNRIQDFQHHSSAVQCFCAFGTKMWVGYANGTLQVIDLEGILLGSWVAHSSPVMKITVGGSYIFTLANHGGIRAWNLMSPGPLDSILRTELASKEMSYTKFENMRILVGTWNVGQERASPDSLISWLGSAASEVGLVVVGLQEVEMGAGFLAMAAAKETVGLEGSANGHWWLDNIGKMLDEGTSFERVGSRQLAGLLVAAWARKNLRLNIGDVDAAAVPCGFGRAIGNKGAVGLRMRIFDRTLCFVNCHFAAHLEAVNRRNADFDHVYRTLTFTRPSTGLPSAQAGSTSAVLAHRGANAVAVQSDDGRPELSEADMVVFFGDFNYRLYGITYDEARDFVSQRCFDWLREKDQLRAEMKAGKVFQGMREGHIKFPPTYKFERHQQGLAGYDSGEKKRIPAWCDRILYRDSRSISVAECSLECPVVSSIAQYDACMDVTDSDHKPVRCIFNVEIARIDERIRRQLYGEIVASNEHVRSLQEEYNTVPETIVSTNNIILQNQDTSILRITNKSENHRAIFEISCEGQSTIKEDGQSSELCPRGSFGFPHWLEVHPAAGIIKPGQIMEVSVHHEDFYTQEEYLDGIPQNWWCEDTRDKEVVLSVNVTGSGSTETRTHHIQVTHCFSAKTLSSETKSSSQRHQSNLLHRSDFAHFGNNADVVQDLCHMRCP